jgi:hypothetical protein
MGISEASCNLAKQADYLSGSVPQVCRLPVTSRGWQRYKVRFVYHEDASQALPLENMIP